MKINNDLIEKDTYSTTEVKTNKVWIDGKPIYRKVVFDSLRKSGTIHIQHGITNLDRMVNIYGSVQREDYQYNLTRISTDGLNFGVDGIHSTYFDMAIPSAFGNSLKNLYVVFEYTKTTD